MTEAETGRFNSIHSAVKAWRHAFTSLASMPLVFGLTILWMVLLNGVSLWLLPSGHVQGVGTWLLSFVLGCVQGFLITPVAIAVHRYALLGETTDRYALNPSDPRFLKFFLFTLVFQLLFAIPNALFDVGKSAFGGARAFAIDLLLFALFIIPVIVALRVLIVFPAVAVDAANAQWRNALSDTKGHTWRVFFVVLVTALPFVAVVTPLQILLNWPPGPTLSGGVIMAIVEAVVSVIEVAALAAAASRLYFDLGARLGRPPELGMRQSPS